MCARLPARYPGWHRSAGCRAGISAGHEQTVDQRVIDDYRVIAGCIVDGLQVVYALIALVAVKQLVVIQEALADKGEVLVEFLLRAFLREGDEGVEADIGQGLLMRLGGWGTGSERDVKVPRSAGSRKHKDSAIHERTRLFFSFHRHHLSIYYKENC